MPTAVILIPLAEEARGSADPDAVAAGEERCLPAGIISNGSFIATPVEE